jgi:hypothetical protein
LNERRGGVVAGMRGGKKGKGKTHEEIENGEDR